MKTFLAEDSQIVRERMRGMIACIPDIELIAEATNENDAVSGIFALLPDLVILDLSLDGGNGMEVLRRIKLQPFAIRVIVFTNSSSPHHRKKCLNLGADYFLDKTMGISRLEELLIQLSAELKMNQGNQLDTHFRMI